AWWWFTDLRVLYRDTRIVPDAPQTWEDLKAASLASVDAGKEGLLFNGGRWEGTTFDWLAHFWAQGGQLVDETGRPVFAEGDNREKLLTAIGFYKDLVDVGAAPSRVTSIVNYDDFNAAAAAGTAALFIGGNWQYGQLRGTLSEEDFAAWEVSAIPGPSADARATGTGGWTIAAMSDDAEAVRICAEMIREIYSGQSNAIQGLLPTSAAQYEQFDAFKGPEYDIFSKALVDGQARPGVPIYPEISNNIQIMMGDVLSGASTPEEALDAANAAVQAAFERL
ncbi:MAG: extracellular solute-binding protein, partial [Pseudomonadota bacterium]